MQSPILFVDTDGKAGKRFHSAAKQYMDDFMPISEAIDIMLTPDTRTVPAMVEFFTG